MQQLSWFQVEREIRVQQQVLRVHHNCRFDKDVFRANDPVMDADGDSTASRHEIAQFCQQAGNYIAQDFVVLADGLPCAVRQQSFSVNDDDSGFSSDIVADLPDAATTGVLLLHVVDPSFLFTYPGESQTTTTSVIAEAPIKLVDDAGRELHRLDLPRSPHSVLRISPRARPNQGAGTPKP
ncbi:MAG: hypothetical protein ACR2IE_08365 [Candidatus Sumerlaeaceae bacterium]